MKMLNQVAEFHQKFNHPIESNPTIPPIKRIMLRNNLIREELEELEEASQNEDIVEVADAVVDLLYVVFGTALEYGLGEKLEALFNEVHASNLSKLENGLPIYANDGKVMKGKRYFKPDLGYILQE